MMIECKAYDLNRCKSCDLIKSPYDDGLNLKINALTNLFGNSKILEPIRSERIIGYRNKAKFIIGGDLTRPILGIPSPADSFAVSPLTDCPLHSKNMNDLANLILTNITEFNLNPYDLKSKKGEFKYLIISQGHLTDELSIRFGMRSLESFERVKKLYNKLIQANKKIKVVCFEVQSKHAAIFEGVEYFLSPDKYIQHDLSDITLSSSTSNFFQVNAMVAKKLYKNVFNRFKDENITISLDLFCGVGGFAQELGVFSKKVFGIEINQVAIDCANFSVKQNDLSNIKFICDDANNFKVHIKEEIDLVVVNPPRRGIGQNLCELLNSINSNYIVYSSCNAKSLSKDIEFLGDNYQIESITPVDMFPLTNHLEVLCILVKVS